MSKAKCKYRCFAVEKYRYNDNCICSLPQLAILILIILQFSDNDHNLVYGNWRNQQISNEILFIIAIYFLHCMSCMQRSGCGY
ncbi:hypothetical protein [Clostridium thermarum]|uniref:hypothetical protein n=1 Tax=Clostridium thermarum TaxID=1716543 RepID=UPI00111E30F8|nr:hypothetical protein [Clostridium thermarum]